MDIPGDVIGVAVALAAGLLIGAERERRKGEGRIRGVAGIRTFAIVGLVGALASMVGGIAILAVALAFVAAAALIGYLASNEEDPGLTTESALVATVLLGALAVEQPELAAGLAVAVTTLLATRSTLHRFVRNVISEEELHDLLIFAAAVVVVLPLVPNEEIGPYDAINPFDIWRLVVLVMGIGGFGYIATRVLGARYGLPIAGLSGGFVSSVATIGSMGSRARESRGSTRAPVAGAVLSSVSTIVQLVVVLAAVSNGVLERLGPSLAAGGIAAVAYGVVIAWHIPREAGARDDRPRRAFSIKDAATFAIIVTAVIFIAAAANAELGDSGVYASASLAGFADAHASAASAAALAASGDISVSSAATAVLLAATTNSITKIAAAYLAGGTRFALSVGAGVVLIVVALWLPVPLV